MKANGLRSASRPSSYVLCLALIGLIGFHSLLAAEQEVAVDPEVAAVLSRYVIKQSDQPIRDSAGWHAPKQVVVYVGPQEPGLRPDYQQWFQQAAPTAKLTFARSRAELQAASASADVVLGSCNGLAEAMPALRWVQRFGVGVERCLNNTALAGADILLTNTRGLSGPYIAEHVIAMTMMLSHGMHHYHANQLKARWQRSLDFPPSVQPVAGENMLVVGLGGIGTKVAEKAAALGMRVTAIRNSSRSGPDFVDYVGLSDELLPLAAKADFVVNTLPLTSKTTGIYDANFFATMNRHSYFISIGRGKSTVTDDLLAALREGHIAGAGLDVVDPEPLPSSHPLWREPNVIITPHRSGRSGNGSPDVMVFVRENLRRYAAGEPMLNVVDRRLEY